MDELKITKDGRLIRTYWTKQNDGTEGKDKEPCLAEKDVTSDAIRYLFSTCSLDEGVTLKSVFLLLNLDLDRFDSVLGNFCRDFANECISSESIPYDNKYDPNSIEYLELYWIIRKEAVWDEDKSTFNPERAILMGTKLPEFHGVGFELKEDQFYAWDLKKEFAFQKKGERINWSISFLKTSDLANIPLKLKAEVRVYDGTAEWREPPDYSEKILLKTEDSEYTLADILNGILFELSFYGRPDQRDKKKKELDSFIIDP
jgi:hypothetical protein